MTVVCCLSFCVLFCRRLSLPSLRTVQYYCQVMQHKHLFSAGLSVVVCRCMSFCYSQSLSFLAHCCFPLFTLIIRIHFRFHRLWEIICCRQSSPFNGSVIVCRRLSSSVFVFGKAMTNRVEFSLRESVPRARKFSFAGCHHTLEIL